MIMMNANYNSHRVRGGREREGRGFNNTDVCSKRDFSKIDIFKSQKQSA